MLVLLWVFGIVLADGLVLESCARVENVWDVISLRVVCTAVCFLGGVVILSRFVGESSDPSRLGALQGLLGKR